MVRIGAPETAVRVDGLAISNIREFNSFGRSFLPVVQYDTSNEVHVAETVVWHDGLGCCTIRLAMRGSATIDPAIEVEKSSTEVSIAATDNVSTVQVPRTPAVGVDGFSTWKQN